MGRQKCGGYIFPFCLLLLLLPHRQSYPFILAYVTFLNTLTLSSVLGSVIYKLLQGRTGFKKSLFDMHFLKKLLTNINNSLRLL